MSKRIGKFKFQEKGAADVCITATCVSPKNTKHLDNTNSQIFAQSRCSFSFRCGPNNHRTNRRSKNTRRTLPILPERLGELCIAYLLRLESIPLHPVSALMAPYWLKQTALGKSTDLRPTHFSCWMHWWKWLFAARKLTRSPNLLFIGGCWLAVSLLRTPLQSRLWLLPLSCGARSPTNIHHARRFVQPGGPRLP